MLPRPSVGPTNSSIANFQYRSNTFSSYLTPLEILIDSDFFLRKGKDLISKEDSVYHGWSGGKAEGREKKMAEFRAQCYHFVMQYNEDQLSCNILQRFCTSGEGKCVIRGDPNLPLSA